MLVRLADRLHCYIDARHAADPTEVEFWRRRGLPVHFVPSGSGFFAFGRWALFCGYRKGYPLNRRGDVKKCLYLVRFRGSHGYHW